MKQFPSEQSIRMTLIVWFHIAPTNIRSQKATQKIGGVFSHKKNANISGKYVPWMFYKIEKENWLQ